ncbi:MAG: class I SAM-dependent methyltransferase [Nitrospiraceae bacterium]
MNDRSDGLHMPLFDSQRELFTAGRVRPVAHRIARGLLFARLKALKQGVITVVEGDARISFGSLETPGALKATIIVHDPACYVDMAFGGTIAVGESYSRGQWSSDDLTTVVRIFVLNREVLDGMDHGWATMIAPLQRMLYRLRRNTRTGSRRNIAAHYDLGNEFFGLILDKTMMYSCAFFNHADATLKDASVAKLDRICRKLRLSSEDHLLEIGTGWGGFAVHAAVHYGCHVTTTTISRKQYEYAVRLVADKGVADRVTVLLKDYRDLHKLGTVFDKIVSIEMIEAVGHQFYDAYFTACSNLLKPTGMMLLQAITIEDRLYERAARSVDFIQRHIFPGSCIPSIGAMCRAVSRTTDFSLFHLEDIGAHYAPTLREWRRGLMANVGQIRQLGFSEEFVRLWDYYFCYCEGGFIERSISNVHMLFVKPLYRVSSAPFHMP